MFFGIKLINIVPIIDYGAMDMIRKLRIVRGFYFKRSEEHIMRKSSGGFTLIELIVVIVILGILAVTAAPKFMNLQGDAKAASLKGVQAALNSAKSMVYAKALLNSSEKKDEGTVTVNSKTVNIVYGYPKAVAADLEAVLDVDFTNDYHIVVETGKAHIFINDPQSTSDANYTTNYGGKCEVEYTQATNADTPATAVAKTTEC